MTDVLYEKQARRIKRRVFHQGTAAIRKGEGCCYTRDWTDSGTGETATDAHGYRDKYVEVPSIDNNLWFAGVAVQDYKANANGQWMEIYEPGSVCMILIGRDTVIGATRLTCSAAVADRGRFIDAGFVGRGSATILQTNASGNLGQSLDGTATVSTATVTKTSLFTNASAGDILVIYGGTDSVPVPLEYVISSVTNNNEAILTSSPGDGDVACYVISGTTSPEAMAYLEDGAESGLTEWIDPVNGAVSVMIGGVTNVVGGDALGSGDATHALADGTPGLKKGFKLWGALSGNDFVVSPDTAGVQLDGSTALNSMEFDGADDVSVVEWRGFGWTLIENSGTGLA